MREERDAIERQRAVAGLHGGGVAFGERQPVVTGEAVAQRRTVVEDDLQRLAREHIRQRRRARRTVRRAASLPAICSGVSFVYLMRCICSLGYRTGTASPLAVVSGFSRT